MNYSIIRYIIGLILNMEAAFMALPMVTAFLYKESQWWCFAGTMVICVAIGILLTRKKPTNKVFYVREGFVTVALSWVVLSCAGAVPFVISGAIPDPVDALFETVSGFTTTGASILPAVEDLPKSILFWRSFTHWVGGMGVLVFLLTLLPLVGGGKGHHMNLMAAESPGPSVSRLVPKVQSTAQILYSIYFAITLLEIVFLLIGGMPPFEAITHALGTAGTGGFGVKNDSLAGYSPYLQNVVTIFMILFGVNFSVYFLLLRKRFSQAFRSEEIRVYFAVILLSIAVITLDIRHMYDSVGTSVRHAAFQVGSIITTTGYATTDFNLWPQLSRTILVLLMFMGACAGSTGGGIKVSRIIMMVKTFRREMRLLIHPRSVQKVAMDGKAVDTAVIRNTSAFLITYIMIFVVSVLILSFEGHDLVTNFTAVAATFNNIGPGLELVGPTQNYALFSGVSKLVLIFDMLAGRLEIFPMLVLFSPKAWKKF